MKLINVKETKKEFLTSLLDKNIRKILDLGCGTGLMSKFFSKNGTKAIGIDIKKIAEDSENFKIVAGDIRKENFGKENDLIIVSSVLHFLEKDEALQVIQKMKKATSKGGYNLLICMSNKEKNVKPDRFYPPLKELINVYNDWIIIKKTGGLTEIEKHDDIGPHQHHLIFVLFQNNRVSSKKLI